MTPHPAALAMDSYTPWGACLTVALDEHATPELRAWAEAAAQQEHQRQLQQQAQQQQQVQQHGAAAFFYQQQQHVYQQQQHAMPVLMNKPQEPLFSSQNIVPHNTVWPSPDSTSCSPRFPVNDRRQKRPSSEGDMANNDKRLKPIVREHISWGPFDSDGFAFS